MALDPLTGVPGLLLAFLLPGLGLSAALFPEKLRRGAGWEGPLEIAVLSVVGSVAITILVGSALAASPAGLGLTFADPTLWVADAAIALAGAAVWAMRRNAPPPEELRESPPPEDAWETLRTLERLGREERRLRRALRAGGLGADRRGELEAELSRLTTERESLKRATEAGHAS